jgi:predicted aspartyl protease
MQRLVIVVILAAVLGAFPSLVDASQGTDSVPFTYAHHEIFLEAMVNGSGPYSFLLDTDTTPSAIDLQLARRLRIGLTGTAGAATGIGHDHVSVIPVSLANVKVGTVSVHAVDAVAVDLSGLSKSAGRRIDGVLGTSFLADRVVQINYVCRTVSFPPDALLEPFTARFQLDDTGNDVSSDVWVNGRRVRATFDTGDAANGFVTARGIATLHLESAARGATATTGQGYNGAAQFASGRLDDVRIGSVRVGSTAIRFLASDREHVDINIGNQILDRFIVTFDYARGLLTLTTPNACGPKGP